MGWQSEIENGRNGGNCCKVRKRGGSSSSSSTVRSYRLKRAVLVGKRGGSSSPAPEFKTTSAIPQNDDAKSYNYSEKEKELLVSARKLAATLWQINGLKEENNVEEERGRKERVFKANSKAWQSDDDHSQGIDKILHTDYPFESDCFMKSRNRLKDVRHGLSTSKQLLEVVTHVWSLEEQQSKSTCLTLFSALKSELDRACIHVSKLIKEQKHSHGAIDFLVEQFEKEKTAWKIREEYRIQSAITAISGDLETEKKLRRQTERLNKKLGRELADTKASLLKATKELESEKRVNEILEEQICDDDSEESKRSYAEWSSAGFYEGDSKAWKRDYCKDESGRYNRIINLKKEQIVSASRTSSQDFTFI
nr:FK506-binding protein 5-like isoform X2 [Ipomoea batatas]GMD71358.1 FK506-binding protein 5-like isoform X2 [Ipomoea batatas]